MEGGHAVAKDSDNCGNELMFRRLYNSRRVVIGGNGTEERRIWTCMRTEVDAGT
jgi:hypothetical protein